MPYPNIKDPAQVSKIDRCVKGIMADPDFKPRGNQSKKSSAIAVCINSIKGEKMSKKTFSYISSIKEELSKGTLIRNNEIFKEGNFGGLKWTVKKLKQIVDNFKELKKTADFDPPVRIGHRKEGDTVGNVKNIVGYIEDVRLGENKKGEKVVLADFDIVDKKFLDEIKSGKYRKKSVEIGPYEDNQGKYYEDVLWGTGIVDTPAVEGMADLAINVYSKPFKVMTKEETIARANKLYKRGNKIITHQSQDAGKIKKAIAAISSLLESSKEKEQWFDVSRLAEVLATLKSRLHAVESSYNKGVTMKGKKSPKSSKKGKDKPAAKGKAVPNKEDKKGKTSKLAKLTRKAINNLPDSAFAYIKSGGKKDASGKTEPRSLRHYPIHDAAHVRNALARIEQGKRFGKEALSAVRAAAKKFGIKVSGMVKKDKNVVQLTKKEYESLMATSIDPRLESLAKEGKIAPGLLEQEKKFIIGLSASQRESYLALKEASPAIIKLNKHKGKQKSKKIDEETPGFQMSEEKTKAVEMAKKNMRSHLKAQGWAPKEIKNYLKEHSL